MKKISLEEKFLLNSLWILRLDFLDFCNNFIPDFENIDSLSHLNKSNNEAECSCNSE